MIMGVTSEENLLALAEMAYKKADEFRNDEPQQGRKRKKADECEQECGSRFRPAVEEDEASE